MENSTRTLKDHQKIKGKSLAWLCPCRSGLKGEMENLIIAAKMKHSVCVIIRGTSCSNRLVVSAGCAVKQKNTQNILL
jgi:hypothetical protein